MHKLEKNLREAVSILFLNNLISHKETVKILSKVQKWHETIPEWRDG